jgi:DNA modification methylase
MKPQIEHVPTEHLIPYARNSRTHSDAQVAQIAASIREFGFTNPVLIGQENDIIAGHGRILAARKLNLEEVPCIRLGHLSETQKRAYVIADNKLALNAGWDEELLRVELKGLEEDGFDLGLVGFTAEEMEELLRCEGPTATNSADADAVPEEPQKPVSTTGDVWQLGPHRVMCGDSTDAASVAKLMDGKTALLIHADPPYGMGKEKDGVQNDNLKGDALDRFQMAWWRVARSVTEPKGSAYIWGNASELWRLWYSGGLGNSERFELRNEIVWNKGSAPGMGWADGLQYQTASERCLFFQFGNQFLGSINKDDFPESWEPLLRSMEEQARKASLQASDVKRLCGCGMFGHWFTRSQFTLIPEKHYTALAKHYPQAFTRPWADLKADWDCVKGGGRSVVNGKFSETRSFFDNTHDAMTDVWEFPRVAGDERHGHATPKPVAMMERVMRSSLPEAGLVFEPFGGSGSTLMGAQKTGRVCFSMELSPAYVDVIVSRWQTFTGKQAVHADTGKTFEEMRAARL